MASGYYELHKEALRTRMREYMKEYYHRNREKYNEYMREYRAKNREKLREYMREYMKKYRKDNPDKIKFIQFKYWSKKVAQSIGKGVVEKEIR